MRKDPLQIFLEAKTAAEEAPDTALEELVQRPFTRDPDPESLDPGERAMAGMLAVGGSVAGGLANFLAQTTLRDVMFKDSVPATKLLPASGQSFIDLQRGQPKQRILGLFEASGRQPVMSPKTEADIAAVFSSGKAPETAAAKAMARQTEKVREISQTVDSFIDKHNLKQKGVTVNLKQGPLNWMLGPRYEIGKKRVYLPDISKEIALHELGHAADYTKGRIGRIRGVAEPMLRRGAQIALPAALIAGDRIKELLPGTVDDKAIEFMQDHAPEIMGATLAATQLYPEAKASYLALKHIAETEGRAGVRAALPRLGAGWGTYVLSAIPAIVGLSLARKYMREARAEKGETEDFVQQKLRELEKTSGAWLSGLDPRVLVPAAARWTRSSARDIAHVGKQIGRQSKEMVQNQEVLRRLSSAAKQVGTDPTFAQGALISAVPAAMGALYLYGTDSGKEIRQRMDPADVNRVFSGKDTGIPVVSKKTEESWREENPLRFAGLVAAGAALSGGIMSKLFSDLSRVL
jgi:hypothetical protein